VVDIIATLLRIEDICLPKLRHKFETNGLYPAGGTRDNEGRRSNRDITCTTLDPALLRASLKTQYKPKSALWARSKPQSHPNSWDGDGIFLGTRLHDIKPKKVSTMYMLGLGWGNEKLVNPFCSEIVIWSLITSHIEAQTHHNHTQCTSCTPN
jgi:hypothetical protein